MFHNKLDGFGGDPRVVVGTNINPKIVGGKFSNKINIDTVCVCSHLHSLQIWFDKTYSFQVRLRRYNFTANHQTLMISCIKNEGDHQPLPDFVANESSSAGISSSGLATNKSRVSAAVKLGVGYDPRRQTALLELRWIERIVKRCEMTLDIPTI
ncbi:hypothetical protein YC2023_040728 [Brassica napus]